MNTPIELDNSEIDILDIKPELMQETHANFFSLIRDVICSTNEHRMNMYTLQERLKAWQENPISPLNDWYSYVDNWINILPSAITFLCGNASEQPDDFVPYMEYKTPLDVYQWIGAGRDSDQLLSNLCTFWLQHRSESKMIKPVEIELDIADKGSTPPPPRCPTTWAVKKASAEDVKSYREQERRRYDNPHKAFTYRCNGYESVVGPLKGIYYPAAANSKARGHTMLNADRPNFVTILSLVRDATARLPNGEGTRADICELLKSSQYISATAPENVLQSVVSGALDRMHTQWDPCVKYDQKRKIWIYLHRHRTEDDFERIHQHYQGVQKVKKNTRKSPAKPKTPKAEKPPPKAKPQKPPVVANHVTTQPFVIKLETEQQKPDEIKEEILVDNKVAEPEVVVVPQQKVLKPKRQTLYQPKLTPIDSTVPSLVPTTPSKGTSLLISNNPPKQLQEVSANLEPEKHLSMLKTAPKGSVVKIMPSQVGKSIIVPTSNQQILKQVPERPKKAQVKQQSLARQTKKKTKELPEGKIPVSIHQQIVQGLTTQQLQNIKNVTLLRTNIEPQQEVPIPKMSSPNTENMQLKTTASLTTAQTQQILQTIKQKYAAPNQQQVLLKQKMVQVNQKQLPTTKNEVPMVAKVLTNAAGQVISVESLLAHQKTHGSLPQGTTLRVQSSKGQQNLIHLTGTTTKPNSAIAHFTVGTQNNLVALTTQPKLVVASQSTTTNVTPAKPQSSRNTSRTHSKVPSVLMNTKIVADTQKTTPQTKVVPLKVPGAKTTARTANFASSLRMLNTGNLNLTTLDGKPVLLASKTGLQSLHGQNVLVQAHPGTNQNASSLVLQGAVTKKPSSQSSVLNQTSSIVFSSAIKNQLPQQVLFSSQGTKGGATTTQAGHIMLGNQPIRLQAGTPAGQRVVLASQSQGGQILAQQILLPAGFQGTAINIKSLQGVKVIPLAQTTQKGQSRQIVAKVMSPSLVKTTQPAPVQLQQESVTIHSSESE
ncbi:unnamed protein product [Ceutorhynchus assimilis]|uniref:Nuclear factor related to kappa-B-binding protein n=1 Tax=Ceutorhynchus assimilis TaxID=467358 RepID=A0A9N9MI54_9CUCU|nr:unnamed protein product [Ceutorhynchus assimilis]